MAVSFQLLEGLGFSQQGRSWRDRVQGKTPQSNHWCYYTKTVGRQQPLLAHHNLKAKCFCTGSPTKMGKQL